MFYIGLDLGQRQDHSAIAIVERPDLRLAWMSTRPSTLLVRRVERMALGTPYPRVVARVREIARAIETCTLVVDGTGVGAPVVELLRSAGLGCGVTAVTITGGEKESGSGAAWNVPKRDLIAGVQLALEKGDLRIARHMKEAGALVRELVDVRVTAGLGTGRVRIGADGSGQHDDLVIALALACWRARWRENGFGPGRLTGV
jgi:class 3 adenylate cyclase